MAMWRALLLPFCLESRLVFSSGQQEVGLYAAIALFMPFLSSRLGNVVETRCIASLRFSFVMLRKRHKKSYFHYYPSRTCYYLPIKLKQLNCPEI